MKPSTRVWGDKRLFVCDEELGGALSCTRREGNTLSTVLRCTWDHGNLDPLTKTSKITATGAHIGIVGHITRAELRRKLEEAEAFNGFANRFLWVCARRHGLVPFPEPMPEMELKEMQRQLYRILMAVRDVSEMSLSLEAKVYWGEIYADVSEDRDGLAGAVINRGEAQLLRLSMIYALLDGTSTIEVDHMRSAKALWDYCRESAEYVFHGFEPDPVGTKIFNQVLRSESFDWKELYPLFSNHISKIDIDTAVNDLIRRGKLLLETLPTGGRPKRILKPVSPPQTQLETSSSEMPSCEQSEESEQSLSENPKKWVEEF